jgi:hypothetical protein
MKQHKTATRIATRNIFASTDTILITVVCATQCFLVSMSTKDSQVDPGYIQISFVFEKNIDVNEVNRVRCNLFEEQTA